MNAGLPIHPDDEAGVAAEMARDLEGVAAEIDVPPPSGFVDRVMAAVAVEPLPQPARAFRVALLGGRLRPAVASLGDAWRVLGGGSRPLIVRAQALALVLVVTIGSLAIAGGATVGAIDLLSAIAPVSPPPTTPVPAEPTVSPSPTPSSPTPDTSPDALPDASSTPEATETTQPTSTETPATTERPRTATPRPAATDDHGGGSGGDGGSGGSGSGGSDQTPTPTPTETDDHGGTDG